MKIYVDIDDTICYYDNNVIRGNDMTDYSLAKPNIERIEKINKLYDAGHEITYWTARGFKTGCAIWFQLTLKQLNEWGCKFHELKLGKPHYNLFIDDKNINSETYFK